MRQGICRIERSCCDWNSEVGDIIFVGGWRGWGREKGWGKRGVGERGGEGIRVARSGLIHYDIHI